MVKFNPTEDLSDLSGKVIIVTGANLVLSVHRTRSVEAYMKPLITQHRNWVFHREAYLADRGAKVYLGSRTEERGKEAVEKLKGEGIGNGDVVFLPCDLGSPASAKKAAEDFLQLENRLDVLGTLSLM